MASFVAHSTASAAARASTRVPYIGAAVGAAGIDTRNGGPDWEFAVSGAVGVLIPIGRRLYLRPDFRIRGIGSALSASISDFGLGLALKL